MALVIADMSTSLDGYITDPNDSRDNTFGDGAGTLHDWFGDAVPSLIGGTALFGPLDTAITLKRTGATVTPAATHLKYRVLKE
jgi:hypothetical protein